MAGGAGVTVGPGTDRYAERFNQAEFSVLAFDYRHLGASSGEPRQVVSVGRQLQDWDAALGLAAGLEEVDPSRRAAWGFSLSGGHLLKVAARDPELAAVIAQSPNADGQASSRNAMRHQSPAALLTCWVAEGSTHSVPRWGARPAWFRWLGAQAPSPC